MFIPGRNTKTSPVSQPSSGFESRHLPSPEYPLRPETLTSPILSKICLPYVLPSPRLPKNSLSLLSLSKDDVPSAVISRSQSCMEIRKDPVSGLLRRSFSLTVLQKKQKKQFVDPKKWNLNPAFKTGETACELRILAYQSSTAIQNAVCSGFSRNTVNVFASKQAQRVQSTDLQQPPTAPGDRLSQTVLMASLQNPDHVCLHTDGMVSQGTGSRMLSATVEAHRLKMRRNK